MLIAMEIRLIYIKSDFTVNEKNKSNITSIKLSMVGHEMLRFAN